MSKKEKVVEFDLANERVIIGTMIHDSSLRKRLSRKLTAGTFGDPKHQAIFRALERMVRGSLDWNEDTLADLAGDDDYGGFGYVRAIVEDYDPTPNVDYHVDRLRLDAAKFAIVSDDLPSISEACLDPKAEPTTLSRKIKAALNRVERMGQRFVASGSELRDGYYEELRMRAIVGDVVDGTGFPVFDRGLTRGFIPGLSVVVGRPGHGKSTWLANLLRNRVNASKPTYVCGWEMSRADYLDMMVSAETEIPTADLARKVGVLSLEEKESIVAAVERFTAKKLLSFETNPFPKLPKPEKRWDLNERNADYLEAVIEAEADRYGLFTVDVFNKMLADRRPDAISELLVRLREAAIANGVHLMLLHHLNRDAASGRPSLEGIKGSGAFEEEADLIFATDRPIMRASPARRKKMVDTLDVHILKQRKGPAPLCFRYRFDGPRSALTDEAEVDVAMLEGADDDGEVA